MKTINSNVLPAVEPGKKGRKWILSVLTVLSFSFASAAQEHNTISGMREQEEQIQQWTEETKSHVPQLNVFNKLTALLNNSSPERMMEDQQSTKNSKSTFNFNDENISEALEKNCGGLLN